MTDTPIKAGPTSDQSAAHEFLSELRTRIATQPLPYQDGVEATALESLKDLFKLARAAMSKYPGCAQFADRVATVLNTDLRPVTAKWHRGFTEGRLSARDGATEFRGDLLDVQDKLRSLAGELHQMAYGTDLVAPQPQPVMSDVELDNASRTSSSASRRTRP